MPACYKHQDKEIKIEWEIGTRCPLCEALRECEELGDRLEKSTKESGDLQEQLQDILEATESLAPPAPAKKRGRFQAPISRSSYADLPDFDDDEF